VPEGYGLLLMQDGALTGFVAEAGGYIWQSDDINSQSIFAGRHRQPADHAELGSASSSAAARARSSAPSSSR
jgi:hypothetical protein